ncbi:MAG: SIS domain-containing protein [Halobacteriovoraceae bacterium]|nr:SIS domain-containing protein [Halobacteriovoraceae bacterium]
MNHLEETFKNSKNKTDYVRSYFNYLSVLMDKMDPEQIAQFIEMVEYCRQKGNTIYFIGNGGSAATASHFANDLQIGARCNPPIKAVALTDNNAIITAIGNDFGYENIFTKQMEKLMKPEDVLVAISASGNSPNIVNAVKMAKDMGAKVIGLSGFDGGYLRELADVKVHVPSNKGEYGPVEDLHMIIDHLIGTYLMISTKES